MKTIILANMTLFYGNSDCVPLAAYCKAIGKQSVHLAGWTQVLYGIIGKRWEKHSKVEPYINEFWVRPYTQSVPQNANAVEGGCYW
ncbi:MAG: hypothetical protein K6G73_07795 [Marinilabiliaceae bacterium]|nr:hypothetical protein [Marinilabiliaceae bacterium]